jgi:DNA polymerase-3 subunit alpha
MAYLEDFGLVKMFILGLKALDVIKRTEDLIRTQSAQYADFSVKSVPENDQAVFSMLGEGDSSHVFQFESEGMQNILRQVKPSSIEDLIILNAIYRPGIMVNIPLLTRRKHGEEPVEYPDPCLEDILKETYGIIVYQEQIMYIIQRIAGYSLAQADLLRRTLCKQNKEQIIFEKENFVMAAEKNGFEEPDAERIFALLVSASPIAFNKSLALAYAIVAYRTAYLKAHFRDDFVKTADYYNRKFYAGT